MQTRDAKIDFLLRDLPDQNGAERFLDVLAQESPHVYRSLVKNIALTSDVLALVAWSPLLGTTIEQNTEYIQWLGRERVDPRVRTSEELKESLARFALINSSLNPQVMLARFRRRELLRTYLNDIRRTHTLVETTEELSNLADAILDYAHSLARQDLDNRYGLPRRTDERGRIATTDFCIVALGKLGSLELNYASDIDLMFLYSEEGSTSGLGQRGEVSNREYFVKLSEAVARIVGQSGGEGAAYRVDLRLRPHGRDGALACSLEEAARYYARTAQAWERQALIRARAAAGSGELFARFRESVIPQIFRPDISVANALGSVRLAKVKIDRQVEKKSGYNVKLGRGGIREIEFIAQALQLAHGGRDEWLRVPHTLVSIERLADRGFITHKERSALSDAYDFLRTVEHRLQMEHGLQTHTVPDSKEAQTLLAARMGFATNDGASQFAASLLKHTSIVRETYERLFADVDSSAASEAPRAVERSFAETLLDKDTSYGKAAARVFVKHAEGETEPDMAQLERLISRSAEEALNPHRALLQLARISASLDKTEVKLDISGNNLETLLCLLGASDFFASMIASNPALIGALDVSPSACLRRDYRAILRSAIDSENNLPDELKAFRLKWSELITEIGTLDALNQLNAFELNRLQTDLAIASINVAYLIARRELARRVGSLKSGPRVAFLGLGRLGSGGVDYGSDLDILIVYDSLVPSPVPSLTQDEAYARLAELMIGALSSITREGYLYRVDLRLRPHGKNGPLVLSAEGFLEYLRQDSAPWEWLAYVKLRAVGGDLELGKMVETHARHRIHANALTLKPGELMHETRRVRDRLEKEKGVSGRQTGIDIKYGPGGMLDVYFLARYLQLRHEVPDEGEDRSTMYTLSRLREEGAISEDDFGVLSAAYELLRSVDHTMRLIVGRSALLPDATHPAATDVAARLGFDSAVELHHSISDHMASIRQTYDRVLAAQAS